MTLRFIAFFTAIAVILAAAWWYSRSASVPAEQSQRSEATKVITETVMYAPNDTRFTAVGTARPRLSVDIYPAVAEEVMRVAFSAGQQVEKGELLVQLDDRQEQLALELAEVRLKEARSLLQRYELAVKNGAVPESEVDSARATYEGAKVALDQAKLDIEERRITAPFAGVVGIPAVDPGDRVTTQTLITGLDAREVMYVDFDVPEKLAGKLQTAVAEKRVLQATTPAYGTVSDAKLIAQQSRVMQDSRTLRARASIDNKDDKLRAGMSLTIAWNIDGAQQPRVPESALQWGNDGAYVWAVRDGIAVRVPVDVLGRDDAAVIIGGELRENEQIVVQGVQRARDGKAVHVLNRPDAADQP